MWKKKDVLAKYTSITGISLSSQERNAPPAVQLPDDSLLSDATYDMTNAVVMGSLFGVLRDHGLATVEPRRSNHRMQFQKGLFIMPTNTDVSFENNIEASFGPNFAKINRADNTFLKGQSAVDLYANVAVAKIKIPRSAFNRFKSTLYQMNLTRDILYPDLEGFISSLQHDGIPLVFSSISSKQFNKALKKKRAKNKVNK